MSHNHHIIKCRVCQIVIAQCRCMSKDKIITYETCDKCKTREKKFDEVNGFNEEGYEWL